MPAVVNSVITDSIAYHLNIMQGDELLFINELCPKDLIDYKFLITSEEISLHIKRVGGDEEIIDIEKDIDEDLGINFESAVFDKVIPCTNKCIFCFVDQQPNGLRKSLYIKDDDWRLSYLQGTYITLTNLSKIQKERIEMLRPGPLYVSVHTTNPDLRAFMLKNDKAKNIMDMLKWLNELEIPVHTQIVLCPGVNDGDELDRTLNDLYSFKSNILSIAVVPVGITKYRNDELLSRVTKEVSEKVIEQISRFNKKTGYNLVYPSDEFYIQAGYELPKTKFYGDFGQLDDGVGTCRLLLDDFKKFKLNLPNSLSNPKEFTLVTGKIAAQSLQSIANELNKIHNLKVNVVPITSKFWGDDVTVTGLITGQDLLDNLLPVKDNLKNIIIPSVMLRKFSNEFLDGLTLQDVKDKLSINIHVIDNYYSNEELINLILS
ncbi:MAG: DUF512 domain-containing protein [Candidatus Gastranaerophilales bacterium]|nr:DUF512 domain-containing protein [Candidatus Gastranaerophilales bacterium]